MSRKNVRILEFRDNIRNDSQCIQMLVQAYLVTVRDFVKHSLNFWEKTLNRFKWLTNARVNISAKSMEMYTH